MKKIYIHIYAIFLLINTSIVYSQEQVQPAIEMFSSIDTMETYIGQYINYKIIIRTLKDIGYSFNDINFQYANDEFNIISVTTNRDDDDEKHIKIIYDYTIAFYNHGIYNMPDYSVEYISDGNTTILSNSPIYVSIKPITDGEYLPPLQNNQKLTFPWLMLVIIVIAAIILISSIIGVLYFVQKRKNTKKNVIIEPEDVEALRELRILENKITWKEISFTEYYFELTQIFRKYLTIRFDLPILEMTTDDIRRHISSKILPSYDAILDFLNYSDFIKFSKLEVTVRDSISNMRFCEMYIKNHGAKENIEKHSPKDSSTQNKKRRKHNENKRNN